MKAVVTVTLKKDVLDPQGAAIQRAAAALTLLQELSEKLLANPVIEDFRIEAVES